MLFLYGCVIATLASCSSDSSSRDQVHNGQAVGLKYATGFSIKPYDNAKLVEVIQPYQGAKSGHQYLLVPRGETIPDHDASVTVIHVPVERMVCTSTTQIPLLDALGRTSALVGFPTTSYICSPQARARIDSGFVADLGVDKSMDLEQLVSIKPEMVMGYSIVGDYSQFKKIEALGVPVIINAEYLETHPLGRAEWIKFMAAFFGEEERADSVFNEIEENYLELTSLVDTVKQRPTVLSGILYGDVWFLPGGANYAATFMRDAGMQYLWEDDPAEGFLQLSFESVYEKAHNADYWIGVGSFTTLEQLGATESRYRRFNAFTKGNVFTYDARKGPTGGSEYLELGYLRPDIVLADLVTIAYPELLPGRELYFYARLK